MAAATSDPTGSEHSAPSTYEQVKWVFLNVLSATGIVFCNKMLFNSVNMSAIWLACTHFLQTFIVLDILARWGVFTPSSVPWTSSAVTRTSAYLAGFVFMTNLSLRINTVGIFQIFKIMNTPVVVLWDYVTAGTLPSPACLGGVALVIAGAVGTVESDVTLTAEGLIVGIAGCLLTVKYQKASREFQTTENLSSLQLLHRASPVGACFLALGGVVEVMAAQYLHGDGGNSIMRVASSGPLSIRDVVLHIVVPLEITSLLAVMVNLSTFRVVAVTSVLTYNVIGHTKTIIVLSGGALLFGEYISGGRGIFMTITLTGIIVYSYVTIKEKEAALKKKQMEEKELENV